MYQEVLFMKRQVKYVNKVNKKTGVIYVYEYTPYWDKKKKQGRNTQICIGKLDPVTGKLIPSKRLAPEQVAARNAAITASAQIIGPSLILDAVTERLGLDKLLKSCFPQTYQQIMTMAYYYLVAHGGPFEPLRHMVQKSCADHRTILNKSTH